MLFYFTVLLSFSVFFSKRRTISTLISFMFILLFSVYDISGSASDRSVVVLNDIHIDIMDYIIPASCTDQEFRQMWAEFEWENKVNYFHFIPVWK